MAEYDPAALAEYVDEPDDEGKDKPTLEEALAPVVIMLNRIYDMLTIVAAGSDEKLTESMVEIHALGGFFGPPPGFDPKYQQELDAR